MDNETDFAPHCLCLDLEVDPVDKRILKIGALRPDTGKFLHFQGKYSLVAALGEVDDLAIGATFVLGHNDVAAAWQSRMAVDAWEVVLPELVIEPES